MAISAKQKSRGLLDPVGGSQLPPANIPSTSNYLPTNSATLSGYNTLAQVLAQGMSPGHPGTQPYYSQADFRAPNGKMSGMAAYAPAMGVGQRGNWGEAYWQQWLRDKGLDQAGNEQRTSGPSANPPSGNTPNIGGNQWMEWLQRNFPGLNVGGANMGGAAVPPNALNAQLQALIQSINRVEK